MVRRMVAVLMLAVVAGCGDGTSAGPAPEQTAGSANPSPAAVDPSATPDQPAPDRPAPDRPIPDRPTPPGAEEPTVSPRPSSASPAPDTGPDPSDGTPQDARLSIPRLGIDALDVIAYRGTTDDAPGTVIQDRGRAASPHGPRGGVGPGGVGNYLVTAHRLSSTRAFLDLPRLRRGDRVRVVADGQRYVYRITATRRTSFRSAVSLRRQRAAVPGRPGVAPTRATITLSTCATPEDRAAGNVWSDEFGNPEHRIDKIGVLVDAGPVS